MILPSKKAILSGALLLILTLALLLSGATPLLSAADRTDASLPVPGGADYSNPGSEATTELSASAFISLLCDGPVSSAEAAYVDSMLVEYPFMYGSAIPPRSVELSYEEGAVTVTIHPYSYVAVNGETVIWRPTAARLGTEALTLTPVGEDGTLRCRLVGLSESIDERLEVSYTATVAVSAAVADTYINYAWSYTDRLMSEHAAYEERLAAYEAYQTYLAAKKAYDAAQIEWEAYLVAKAKYDKLFAEYQVYEQSMADYREKQAAYEKYLSDLAAYNDRLIAWETAYAAYIAELNAYNAALPAYELYLAEITAVTDRMAALESVFVFNSRGKQMYATLMGDTVATVVGKKSELVSVGKCDPADIDRAAASTAVLQQLMTEYKGLKTLPERFAFYQSHYTEIRKNFIDLYGSLRSLYNNDIVKSTLINYEKLERFIEFLSQLYVISTGLDDSQNRAEDWVIYGRYDAAYYGEIPHTYQTELEPSQIPPDRNNSDPTGLSCPTVEVPAPTRPAPMTLQKPIPPVAVEAPLEPDPVIKPTAPPLMEEPVPPVAVADPGEKPIAPAYTALQQELMAAYRAGTLSRRPEGVARTVTLETSLQKRLVLQSVEFYDADGQTLLYTAEQETGSPIVYGGPTPTRPSTDKYTYRFVGWKDQDGNLLADLGVLDEPHKVFYASYEATLRRYTVTWRIDGVETPQSVPYGTVPRYEGTPSRASTTQYDYTFTGWQVPGEDGWGLELPPVSADVTYEAAFEARTRRYTVTWVYHAADGGSSSALWDFGTVPTPDRTPVRPEDDRYLYEFTGWDTEPAAVAGDVTYTAQYNAIPILPSTDGAEPPHTVTLAGEVYAAAVPANGLQVDRLLSLALTHDRTVALTSADGLLTLSFNQAVLTNLSAAGCTYVHISPEDTARNLTAPVRYDIRLTDAEHRAVILRYPLNLRLSGASTYTRAYDVSADAPVALPFAFAEGELTLKISRNTVLQFQNECAVTVTPCENGMLSVARPMAVTGETVSINLTFTDEYELASLRVVGDLTGREYPVGEDRTFLMPDEPVTVSAELVRPRFTVTFIVDGKVYAEALYYKGDTVILPDEPKKAGEGTRVYTFTGWTPAVTTVTGDAVYTAQFRESTQGDSHTYIPPDSRNRVYLLYIEVGLILALLIATPIVIVVTVKRRKRRRRLADKQDPDHTPPSDRE